MKHACAAVVVCSLGCVAAAQSNVTLLGRPAESLGAWSQIRIADDNATIFVSNTWSLSMHGFDATAAPASFVWSQGAGWTNTSPGTPGSSNVNAIAPDGTAAGHRAGGMFVAPFGTPAPTPIDAPGTGTPFVTAVGRGGASAAGFTSGLTDPAWVWTPSGGFSILPLGAAGRPTPIAVSDDGATVAGNYSTSRGNVTQLGAAGSGFIITEGTTYSVPGTVTALTPDGATAGVVANGRASLWTADGGLSFITAQSASVTNLPAISDDGSMALMWTFPHQSLVWTQSGGTVDGLAFLSARGVNFGFQPLGIYMSAISPDQSTIAGYVIGPGTGSWQVFVATIPSPTAASVGALFACTSARRRSRL